MHTKQQPFNSCPIHIIDYSYLWTALQEAYFVWLSILITYLTTKKINTGEKLYNSDYKYLRKILAIHTGNKLYNWWDSFNWFSLFGLRIYGQVNTIKARLTYSTLGGKAMT